MFEEQDVNSRLRGIEHDEQMEDRGTYTGFVGTI